LIDDDPSDCRRPGLSAMTAIDLIAAASGAGASDPGMALAPAALREAGIAARLERCGVAATWQDIAVAVRGERMLRMSAAAAGVAVAVEETVRHQRRFVMLGGDHSLAAGTWSGVANALGPGESFGLLWIDAHMDAHTPRTTPSGDGHGMPLAHLLGEEVPAFAPLCRAPPALRPHHVCLIGSNSFEAEEAALLARLGVRVFPAAQVHREGFAAVLNQALAQIHPGARRFGVSLDVDVIDHAEAPGVVASKVHHPLWPGLRAPDVRAGLTGLAGRPGFIGMDMVELNPLHDVDGRTVALALDLVSAIFAPV
jgi:arginase